MATKNWLSITSDMTATDRNKYKQYALAAGLQRCVQKSIGTPEQDIPGLQGMPSSTPALLEARIEHIKNYILSGKWPASVAVRELIPGTAALPGDLVAPPAIDSWLTAPLAAVGVAYSCFQAIAAPVLVQNRLMVGWGVSVDSAAVPLPVSRLIFRRTGVAGSIQAQFDMEPMMVRQEVDAFFSEPVVIDPQVPFAIQVVCRNATLVAEIVHIHNYLFETAPGVVVG